MIKSKVAKLMDEHDPKITIRAMQKETMLAQTTILRARCNKGIESCTLSTLERIARALGCSIHDLFEDNPERGN